MGNFSFSILIVLVFCSCDYKKNNGNTNILSNASIKLDSAGKTSLDSSENQLITQNNEIKLTNGLKPENISYGCMLSKNKSDFAAGKFIYLLTYDDNGFLEINGNPIKIKNVHDSTSDYTVQLIFESGESRFYSGKIKVKTPQGIIIEDFYGECGD